MTPPVPAPPSPLSYRDAGVDIDAGDALVERIKPFAKRTLRPEVLAGIGGFGALVELPKRYREPVLVSGTDGVGTKLKLAFALNRHDTIGIDLVAMSVNDILVQGAEPLFFLDYYVCERLDVAVAADVIKGIADRLRAGRLRADRRRNGRDARHVHPGRIRPRRLRGRRRREGEGHRRHADRRRRRPARPRVERSALQRLLADPPDPRGFGRRPRAPVRRHRRRAHAGRGLAGTDADLREAGAGADAAGRRQGHGAHHRRRIAREHAPDVLRTASPPASSAGAGHGRRSSTGCRRRATSPTPKCTACSTAASAW